jgi:Glucose-6-phosphate dehydrogenase, C-terminal domain
MDQPARIDVGSFRGVRVEGLRAVATPAAETMRRDTVRARYTAGTIGTRAVPSYIDEPGVDPSRNTETYASLTLQVDSPRWAGVPFTLRSGKALAADSAEIAIHFRPLPRYLLSRWPGVEPNVLRVGLTEPYVRQSTTLNGPERTAETRQLEARATPPRFTAYAHLILEMLNSDPMLFIAATKPKRPGASSTPSCTHGQPETSPCRNAKPARHHRARRPDTNGHVPASRLALANPGHCRNMVSAGRQNRLRRSGDAAAGRPAGGADRRGDQRDPVHDDDPAARIAASAGVLAAAGLTAGSACQQAGLREAADRRPAQWPVSVTSLRASGRPTGDGSLPCCAKCREWLRSAGRCWSAGASGCAARQRSVAR